MVIFTLIITIISFFIRLLIFLVKNLVLLISFLLKKIFVGLFTLCTLGFRRKKKRGVEREVDSNYGIGKRKFNGEHPTF